MPFALQSVAGRILPAHAEGIYSCKLPSAWRTHVLQGTGLWEGCFIHEGFNASLLLPLQGHLIGNLHVLPADEVDLCPVSERCLIIIGVNFQMSL